MKYTFKIFLFLFLIIIGCNSSSNNDHKEKELLQKEIELLKKENKLLQNISSNQNIDKSSVYGMEETKEIKQTIEDRIIEIKEFYSKILKTTNKYKNCKSSKKIISDEKGEYENAVKICRLKDNFSYKQGKLKGWEWQENANFYYKNNKCFFVYINGSTSGSAYSYRVYYDRKGNVIRILLAENDFDDDNVGSNVEVHDTKKKQEILSSIASTEKELSDISK